jgi:hypothetical protein
MILNTFVSPKGNVFTYTYNAYFGVRAQSEPEILEKGKKEAMVLPRNFFMSG